MTTFVDRRSADTIDHVRFYGPAPSGAGVVQFLNVYGASLLWADFYTTGRVRGGPNLTSRDQPPVS